MHSLHSTHTHILISKLKFLWQVMYLQYRFIKAFLKVVFFGLSESSCISMSSVFIFSSFFNENPKERQNISLANARLQSKFRTKTHWKVNKFYLCDSTHPGIPKHTILKSNWHIVEIIDSLIYYFYHCSTLVTIK